ncbi:hypothetical protein [Aeromicrobium massiliense]|uniref:hypothetical protein n=1 Tax=Aeromicrobium massiliense TaxID=1464554 RepID=UPI00031BF7F3|nr:hypothetical protein [Aeromicrobium massiliense]
MDEGRSRDDLDEVLMAVDVPPEWDDPLARVEDALAAAGTAGWLATDVHAGRPRVLVRTVGDRITETMATSTPGPPAGVTMTPFDALADLVESRLGSPVTFDVAEDGGWGAVAAARLPSGRATGEPVLTAHAAAYRSGLPTIGAQVEGWTVLAPDGASALASFEAPLDVMVRGIGAAATCIVLVRNGATTQVALARDGEVAGQATWDRPWREYAPAPGPGADEVARLVRTVLPESRATGADIGEALGLVPGAARRWDELVASPLTTAVDVRELVDVLGLPEVAADAVIDPTALGRVPTAVRAAPRARRR